MLTLKTITHFVEMHQTYAYIILFLGVMIEGEFSLIFAGILSHLGAIEIFPAVSFAFLGSIAKSIVGYFVGSTLNKKYSQNSFFKYVDKKVMFLLPHFKEKPFWSIVISKFIVGVNNFTLVFSGYIKVKLRTYIKAEFLATAIWFPSMIFLGYFFSYTAFNISKEIRKFTLIILLFVIGFILFEKLIAFLYEIFEEYHDRTK